jgi:tetratricopeptide (TPR) repeat protein
VFVYWFAHASVDWFWAFFGLTAPALAALAMAASTSEAARRRSGRRAAKRGPVLKPALVAVGCVAGALLAGSLAAPWLSARQVEHATEIWREDPSGAEAALDRAAALNPLSTVPAVTAGAIALRQQRTEAAADRFREALERDPENSYSAFELGLIAAARGRMQNAVELLRQSLAQNPRDELVRDVLRDVRKGRKVSPSEVNDTLAQEARDVIRRSANTGP